MSKGMSHLLNASQIADYFLLKAHQDGKPVTNKKLQKLLYYAQAWSVTQRGKKLFADKIEAWVHGPAIKEIYLKYRNFGSSPISVDVSDKAVIGIPQDVQEFLDEIWKVYGKFDAAYLEQLTHSETPWLKAREGLDANVGSDKEITTDSMREYYSVLAEKAQ